MSPTGVDGMKLRLLALVYERKAVLFGEISAQLTAKDIRESWEEIFKEASSFGYPFPPNKSGSYVRDTVWPNLRNRTKTKIDERRQTGNGKLKKEIDEIDEKVLDIIGRESPEIEGLNVRESGEVSPVCSKDSPSTSAAGVKKSVKRKGLVDMSNDDYYDDVMRERKVSLQIEHLQVSIYKAKLECFEIEDRLGVKHKFDL